MYKHIGIENVEAQIHAQALGFTLADLRKENTRKRSEICEHFTYSISLQHIHTCFVLLTLHIHQIGPPKTLSSKHKDSKWQILSSYTKRLYYLLKFINWLTNKLTAIKHPSFNRTELQEY